MGPSESLRTGRVKPTVVTYADRSPSPSTVALLGLGVVLLVAYATFGWVPGPGYPTPVPYETRHGDVNLSAVAGDDPVRVSATLTYRTEDTRWRNVRLRTIDPASNRSVGLFLFDTGDGWTDVVSYTEGERQFEQRRASTRSKFTALVNGADEVVRVDPATRTLYAIDLVEPPDLQFDGGLALGSLGAFAWERTGRTTYEGRDVVRYEPETGWVFVATDARGGGDRRYVKDASGELLVDRATGVPLYANVTGVFEPATTWGEVILGTDFSLSVTYEVDLDAEPPTEPIWVDAVRGEANWNHSARALAGDA